MSRSITPRTRWVAAAEAGLVVARAAQGKVVRAVQVLADRPEMVHRAKPDLAAHRMFCKVDSAAGLVARPEDQEEEVRAEPER